MPVEGVIRAGLKTKDLVKRLNQNEIAVICHDDIDILSAIALINTGVRTILNTGRSMTGKQEASGTGIILSNGIALYDVSVPFDKFNNNDSVLISYGNLFINGVMHRKCCKKVNSAYMRTNLRTSKAQRVTELDCFIRNTLEHAGKDIERIISFNDYPDLDICIRNKRVVVVARNSYSMQELTILKEFISKNKPVIIAVDGGADILLNAGYRPDILIGDMDSVSDLGIYKSKEIILQTYSDGCCPCEDRISAIRQDYKTIAVPGTSEDAALLLAYAKGAVLIVLAGGHSSMEDFLAKGRSGMGSTVITRLMVGHKLLDLKNINQLMH